MPCPVTMVGKCAAMRGRCVFCACSAVPPTHQTWETATKHRVSTRLFVYLPLFPLLLRLNRQKKKRCRVGLTCDCSSCHRYCTGTGAPWYGTARDESGARFSQSGASRIDRPCRLLYCCWCCCCRRLVVVSTCLLLVALEGEGRAGREGNGGALRSVCSSRVFELGCADRDVPREQGWPGDLGQMRQS